MLSIVYMVLCFSLVNTNNGFGSNPSTNLVSSGVYDTESDLGWLWVWTQTILPLSSFFLSLP